MSENPKTPGQIAYEAYCEYVGWKSVMGQELPQWAAQRENLKGAWQVAALEVLRQTDFEGWDRERRKFIEQALPKSER